MATKPKPKQSKAAKPQVSKKAAPKKAAKPAKAKPPKAAKPAPKKATAKPAPRRAAAKPAAKSPAPKKPQPPKKAAAAPPPPRKKPAAKKEVAAPPPQTTAPSPTPSSPTLSPAPSRSTPTPSASSPTDAGVRYLTAQDIVELHRAVSTEFGGNAAHPGVVDSQFALNSAVNRPQITTLGREAYPSFSDKVAALVFALLQTRPFRGGNRRVALATLLAFVEVNNRAVDSKIFDEKTAETVLKRAANCRELGIPPENAFRELRETLSRSIIEHSA